MAIKETNLTLSIGTILKGVAMLLSAGAVVAAAKALPKVIETQEIQGKQIVELQTARTYGDKRMEKMDEKLDKLLFYARRKS